MNDWTSGYVAEIGYTYDFFHAMTPTRMGLAALSKGVQHPFGRETFSYCELGCGQGFTANVIAAANPHIDVHAMDFNPAHIAEARALAEQGDVQNVHFYERSFADFAGSPGLPSEFDVIALHGILSWVSRDNQRLVYDFIAKHLKPGGVVSRVSTLNQGGLRRCQCVGSSPTMPSAEPARLKNGLMMPLPLLKPYANPAQIFSLITQIR
jgi:2-polyprenyl-3-methyl-5-hydroxy-6-metoxy-1,4-benzoquinol methylase